MGFWSIPRKLLVLLLLVFLLASGIIVASCLVQRGRAIKEAERGAMLLVQSLAAQQEQVTAGTKQMLSTLAQLPEVKNLDSAACNEIFRQLHGNYPAYSLLAAVRPDGSGFASDPPFDRGTNLFDRKHVRDAIRTLDFSVGDYIVGRISKVPVIAFAYPVLGPGENLTAVLIAGLRLDTYANFLTKAHLPPDSTVTISDRNGLRLFRFPENDAAGQGKPLPADTFKQMSGGLDMGTLEATGGDGVYRIYAFKQLRLHEDSSPVSLSDRRLLQQTRFLRTANLEMFGYLSVLGSLGLLAMYLVWKSANRLLIQPVNQLVKTTQRFGKGEMWARTGFAALHQ